MVGDEGRAFGHVEAGEDQLFGDFIDILHGEEVGGTLVVGK